MIYKNNFIGLCGAIHSGVARQIRAELAADPSIKVICVGDKNRAILQRMFAKNILMVASEVSLKFLIIFFAYRKAT